MCSIPAPASSRLYIQLCALWLLLLLNSRTSSSTCSYRYHSVLVPFAVLAWYWYLPPASSTSRAEPSRVPAGGPAVLRALLCAAPALWMCLIRSWWPSKKKKIRSWWCFLGGYPGPVETERRQRRTGGERASSWVVGPAAGRVWILRTPLPPLGSTRHASTPRTTAPPPRGASAAPRLSLLGLGARRGRG